MHNVNFKHTLALLALGLMACQKAPTQAVSIPQPMPNTSQEITPLMSDKEKAVVAKIEWVRTADAAQDAMNDLARTGVEGAEVIAFSGRGKSFPGLSKAEYTEIAERVTYRFADGTGDVIYGATHKALRRELRAYVSEYNRVVYNVVTSAR